VSASSCRTGRSTSPSISSFTFQRNGSTTPKRRTSARIPEGLAFKTKPELALDMLSRAMADGIPGEIVLADSAYGDSSAFRDAVRAHGLDYAVGIKSPTRVWLLDQNGEPERIVSAKELAKEVGQQDFRVIPWRTGTKGKLSSRFYFRRVKPVRGAGELEEKEALWLGIVVAPPNPQKSGPPADMQPSRTHPFSLPTIRRYGSSAPRLRRASGHLVGRRGARHEAGLCPRFVTEPEGRWRRGRRPVGGRQLRSVGYVGSSR
jgi:DDE superfamily endonuclease